MVFHRVLASLATLAPLQIVDMNVPSMLNAPATKPVYVTSVKIHALVHVESMPCAMSSITLPFALALMDILETLSQVVIQHHHHNVIHHLIHAIRHHADQTLSVTMAFVLALLNTTAIRIPVVAQSVFSIRTVQEIKPVFAANALIPARELVL